MPTLAALLLATPVWGFALRPPTAVPSFVPETAGTVDRSVELRMRDDERAAELHNETMMQWTRGMSLATMFAFAGAGALGVAQFSDEYGMHARQSETACATGNAALDACGESTPWAHVALVGATAGLGLTTFVLSTQVDFERAARRDADWRIYEVTRWVGLGMFLVQAAGGFLLANAVRFGWADPQSDFQTLQGFAAAHLALGLATFGLEAFNTAIMF